MRGTTFVLDFSSPSFLNAENGCYWHHSTVHSIITVSLLTPNQGRLTTFHYLLFRINDLIRLYHYLFFNSSSN